MGEVTKRLTAAIGSLHRAISGGATGALDHHAPTSMPALAPGRGADGYEQLRQLGELRDAGILTEEEFAAEKAEVLNRI